jgi:hypothetical protein
MFAVLQLDEDDIKMLEDETRNAKWSGQAQLFYRDSQFDAWHQ